MERNIYFIWCGQKKRRDAGVGMLIKKCREITFDELDIIEPRIMAMNMQIKDFSIRLTNVYSPTNCRGSDNQKYIIYRTIRKTCNEKSIHQKLIVTKDFNATTSISLKNCYFDGKQVLEDDVCNDNGF